MDPADPLYYDYEVEKLYIQGMSHRKMNKSQEARPFFEVTLITPGQLKD